MRSRQPALPAVWLITDARNDAVLERALRRLPRGSGLIFRHYHLNGGARRARFEHLRQVARTRGHRVVLAGTVREARRWRADGAYGSPVMLAQGPALLRLATVHSLREIGAARRSRSDAVLLSPVYATRSHPDGEVLGPIRFRLLAAYAGVPVTALGGMTARRARALGVKHWAAIDGLSSSGLDPGPLASSTEASARPPAVSGQARDDDGPVTPA